MLPLEYQIALDVLPSFVSMSETGWICQVDAFYPELQNRLPHVPAPQYLVWIEPQMAEPLPSLNNIQRLILIASRPLARILPERKAWQDDSVGLRWRGTSRFQQPLRQEGWHAVATHHFHTLQSIILNRASEQLTRIGQPARADRWQFAARQRYATSNRAIATASLFVYERSRT